MSEQKFALITGASSGIGYAIAKALSIRGYKVLACSPKNVVSSMDPLAKEYGVIPFDCDITNLEDIKRMARLVKEKTGGKLDILYNNSGIGIGGPAIEMDEKELDRVFQINVIGHINVTKHLSEFVIAAKGVIVFTSSVASIVPLSWVSAYNATKAAINMYAKTLDMEMKPFGVKVYSVITGGVNTAICDNSHPHAFDKSRYNVEGAEESMVATRGMSRNRRTTEEPDVYAEGVVNKITKRKRGFNIYKGARAYSLYLLSILAPLWFIQGAIAFHFKQLRVFRNIKRIVASERKLKSA